LRRGVMAFMVATAGLAATAATAEAATLGLSPVKPCQLSGEKINMLGGGYTPNGYVDFAIDGQALGNLLADAAGSVAGSITLGALKGVKTHVVQAVDETNAALTAQASFVGTTRQVTVKPKHARAGKKLKIRGYGFLQRGKAYMHVRGHGLSIDSRVGKPGGPCGTWAARKSIVPTSAASGVYKVQFDQKKRFSKKTRPRVRGTMTVTRTFHAAGAFGGARLLYTWTQVD
jgi:hypothetical protein